MPSCQWWVFVHIGDHSLDAGKADLDNDDQDDITDNVPSIGRDFDRKDYSHWKDRTN